MRHLVLFIVLFLPLFAQGSAWKKSASFAPDDEVVYRTIEGQFLKLHMFYPEGGKPATARPAIVFFHGGGFSKGNPGAFFYACDYFSSRGMVAVSAQYRLRNKAKGYTRQTCLKDAKSAMRYIRQDAESLGIDPDKLAAAGGSAGGHLAAALATSTLINNDGDDLSVSTVPDAIVLFNPILGMRLNRLIDESIAKDFSPYHNAHTGIPPTLAMWGDDDKFMSVEQIGQYKSKLEELGVGIEVEVYPGQRHSFFDNSREWVVTTLSRMDRFLQSRGFLQGPAGVETWADELGR
ncbi:peptidase S9 [Coraliomargarita sinensis]|uniref:Peptidase S9 n=1 Tax=Coraliomargarita sinensis TaxID=2174842 RepID=A0A317ZE22_9BACT|nr:alpha/beta hydrolase [Coraliomargarita sinensis]PXA03526.1 peptidase S9 [Coraliomargarita sinensis]